jgi:LPS sulfotransferase NodH
MTTPACPLEAVREDFRSLGSPVVVFCKSHSGSRLLARAIEGAGYHMGAHQNESSDSLDLLRLVRHLVERYYPDYRPLWSHDGDQRDRASTAELIREVFADHLQGSGNPGGRWGWKLCETGYILPVIDFLFPQARYIHLIRDGRDVAFCDHTPADTPFWKKVYFNTDRMEVWRRYRLNCQDYHRRSHLFNALHWVNSVRIGRDYGAMLRDRYLEVRYEELCGDFRSQVRKILAHIGVADDSAAVSRLATSVHSRSIGKYRLEPRSKVREVLQIEQALLLELGYLGTDPFAGPSRSFRRRIRGLLSDWTSRTPDAVH